MKTFNAVHFLLNTTLAASSRFSVCLIPLVIDLICCWLSVFCLARLFFVLKPRAELFTYLAKNVECLPGFLLLCRP